MRTHNRSFIATALLVGALMVPRGGAADEQATPTWTDECQATMVGLFKEIELVRHDQQDYRGAVRNGTTSTAAAKLQAIRTTLDRMDAQIAQAERQCGPHEPLLRKVQGFAKDRRAWLRSRPKI